ncbi:hypothetical protein D8780_15650 [Notoacmeibacter ruber]|uniref:Uncharacterized protein n=2 Tax=Notoacmeibacter ruber TaxID=2670375 RepID=A0A3L7J3F0_9HYPH|nr:hypothetical protein D8780_15650 [Notoacmeibacter ruber]
MALGCFKNIVASACFCASFAMSSAANADPAYYEGIPAEAVSCIVENLDVYRATENAIVIIRPDICPNTDALAGSLDGRINMLPGSSFYHGSGPSAPSRTLAYTKPQLECLAELKANRQIDLLPKDPCSIR